MHTYQIRYTTASGQKTAITGLFRHTCDAITWAFSQGGTRITARAINKS